MKCAAGGTIIERGVVSDNTDASLTMVVGDSGVVDKENNKAKYYWSCLNFFPSHFVVMQHHPTLHSLHSLHRGEYITALRLTTAVNIITVSDVCW